MIDFAREQGKPIAKVLNEYSYAELQLYRLKDSIYPSGLIRDELNTARVVAAIYDVMTTKSAKPKDFMIDWAKVGSKSKPEKQDLLAFKNMFQATLENAGIVKNAKKRSTSDSEGSSHHQGA